jgi:hypothetical protein
MSTTTSTAEVGSPQYPPATIPTIFADGVTNFNNSIEITKFYFFRFDPTFAGVGPALPQVFAQVAMPMSGFVATVAFFKAAVEKLVEQGQVSKEAWENAQTAQSGFKFNA